MPFVASVPFALLVSPYRAPPTSHPVSTLRLVQPGLSCRFLKLNSHTTWKPCQSVKHSREKSSLQSENRAWDLKRTAHNTLDRTLEGFIFCHRLVTPARPLIPFPYSTQEILYSKTLPKVENALYLLLSHFPFSFRIGRHLKRQFKSLLSKCMDISDTVV